MVLGIIDKMEEQKMWLTNTYLKAWFEQSLRVFVNLYTNQDAIVFQPKELVPCSKYAISQVNMGICEWQKL